MLGNEHRGPVLGAVVFIGRWGSFVGLLISLSRSGWNCCIGGQTACYGVSKVLCGSCVPITFQCAMCNICIEAASSVF